ncbi:unnamed protein product [Gordionus sp. m RMFG-2023]
MILLWSIIACINFGPAYQQSLPARRRVLFVRKNYSKNLSTSQPDLLIIKTPSLNNNMLFSKPRSYICCDEIYKKYDFIKKNGYDPSITVRKYNSKMARKYYADDKNISEKSRSKNFIIDYRDDDDDIKKRPSAFYHDIFGTIPKSDTGNYWFPNGKELMNKIVGPMKKDKRQSMMDVKSDIDYNETYETRKPLTKNPSGVSDLEEKESRINIIFSGMDEEAKEIEKNKVPDTEDRIITSDYVRVVTRPLKIISPKNVEFEKNQESTAVDYNVIKSHSDYKDIRSSAVKDDAYANPARNVYQFYQDDKDWKDKQRHGVNFRSYYYPVSALDYRWWPVKRAEDMVKAHTYKLGSVNHNADKDVKEKIMTRSSKAKDLLMTSLKQTYDKIIAGSNKKINLNASLNASGVELNTFRNSKSIYYNNIDDDEYKTDESMIEPSPESLKNTYGGVMTLNLRNDDSNNVKILKDSNLTNKNMEKIDEIFDPQESSTIDDENSFVYVIMDKAFPVLAIEPTLTDKSSLPFDFGNSRPYAMSALFENDLEDREEAFRNLLKQSNDDHHFYQIYDDEAKNDEKLKFYLHSYRILAKELFDDKNYPRIKTEPNEDSDILLDHSNSPLIKNGMSNSIPEINYANTYKKVFSNHGIRAKIKGRYFPPLKYSYIKRRRYMPKRNPFDLNSDKKERKGKIIFFENPETDSRNLPINATREDIQNGEQISHSEVSDIIMKKSINNKKDVYYSQSVPKGHEYNEKNNLFPRISKNDQSRHHYLTDSLLRKYKDDNPDLLPDNMKTPKPSWEEREQMFTNQINAQSGFTPYLDPRYIQPQANNKNADKDNSLRGDETNKNLNTFIKQNYVEGETTTKVTDSNERSQDEVKKWIPPFNRHLNRVPGGASSRNVLPDLKQFSLFDGYNIHDSQPNDFFPNKDEISITPYIDNFGRYYVTSDVNVDNHEDNEVDDMPLSENQKEDMQALNPDYFGQNSKMKDMIQSIKNLRQFNVQNNKNNESQESLQYYNPLMEYFSKRRKVATTPNINIESIANLGRPMIKKGAVHYSNKRPVLTTPLMYSRVLNPYRPKSKEISGASSYVQHRSQPPEYIAYGSNQLASRPFNQNTHKDATTPTALNVFLGKNMVPMVDFNARARTGDESSTYIKIFQYNSAPKIVNNKPTFSNDYNRQSELINQVLQREFDERKNNKADKLRKNSPSPFYAARREDEIRGNDPSTAFRSNAKNPIPSYNPYVDRRNKNAGGRSKEAETNINRYKLRFYKQPSNNDEELKQKNTMIRNYRLKLSKILEYLKSRFQVKIDGDNISIKGRLKKYKNPLESVKHLKEALKNELAKSNHNHKNDYNDYKKTHRPKWISDKEKLSRDKSYSPILENSKDNQDYDGNSPYIWSGKEYDGSNKVFKPMVKVMASKEGSREVKYGGVKKEDRYDDDQKVKTEVYSYDKNGYLEKSKQTAVATVIKRKKQAKFDYYDPINSIINKLERSRLKSKSDERPKETDNKMADPPNRERKNDLITNRRYEKKWRDKNKIEESIYMSDLPLIKSRVNSEGSLKRWKKYRYNDWPLSNDDPTSISENMIHSPQASVTWESSKKGGSNMNTKNEGRHQLVSNGNIGVGKSTSKTEERVLNLENSILQQDFSFKKNITIDNNKNAKKLVNPVKIMSSKGKMSEKDLQKIIDLIPKDPTEGTNFIKNILQILPNANKKKRKQVLDTTDDGFIIETENYDR